MQTAMICIVGKMKVKIVDCSWRYSATESTLSYWLRWRGVADNILYCASYGCPTPPVQGVTVQKSTANATDVTSYIIPVCPHHAAAEFLDLYDFEPLAPVPTSPESPTGR